MKAFWECNEDFGDAHKDDGKGNDSDDGMGEKKEAEGMESEKEDSGNLIMGFSLSGTGFVFCVFRS